MVRDDGPPGGDGRRGDLKDMHRRRRTRFAGGWLVLIMAAALALGAVTPYARAQAEEAEGAETPAPAFPFGVVDSDRIIDEYLAEELREPLTRVTMELQSEFDAESADMDDEEKAILFETYQARLGAIREAMVQERLPKIRNAIRDVAAAHGFVAIFDASAVHYGGVDVTDEVLAKLGVVVARRDNRSAP